MSQLQTPPAQGPQGALPPPVQADFGLLGLVLLAQFHGVPADMAQLQHQFGQGREPFSETELNQSFSTLAPNQAWVADITYIRVKQR